MYIVCPMSPDEKNNFTETAGSIDVVKLSELTAVVAEVILGLWEHLMRIRKTCDHH